MKQPNSLSTPRAVVILLAISFALGGAHYWIRETFFPEHSFHPKEPESPTTANTPLPNIAVEVSKIGETIRPKELSALLQQKSNILIVDVRAAYFYKQGHIPSAVNWEQGEFSTWEPRERERMKPSAVNWEQGEFSTWEPRERERMKNAERVILYCWDRSCKSSKDVAELLRSCGHKNITVLTGGISAWKHANFRVEE